MHQIINTRCDVFVVAKEIDLFQKQGGNESVKCQLGCLASINKIYIQAELIQSSSYKG